MCDMNSEPLRLILDDLRGTGNVGSILRTADACGVELVYACGTTPYPRTPSDHRPEHVIVSNTRSIAKTALGAESIVPVQYETQTTTALAEARLSGFIIIVLEQTESSLKLSDFNIPPHPIALVVGHETQGVQAEVIEAADLVLELPMVGQKESLNVAVATGIALYQLRFATMR
jgi:23S rRNA (guanosine2251-2'-O)-methyltransferase